jgi:anti-sigma B factor antagonist
MSVCGSGSTVQRMDSAFPADIVGLKVAEHGPDTRIVTVTGEVDALTAPELAACLTTQLAVARLVVVDLDGVQFLASAGLRALFEVNELATQQDRRLKLVCNSSTVNLVVDTAGLQDRFFFADSVADALNDTSWP